MRQALIFFAFSAPFLAGCAAERFALPLISAGPREGLFLETPILVSLVDGRVDTAEARPVETLQAELSRIYGSNLEWVPLGDATPPDRVAVRFRIRALGASFGSRFTPPAVFLNAIQQSNHNALGPWGWVVNSATSTTTGFAESAATGWWYGTAWIDFELQDNRSTPSIYFKIPLAADRKKWNLWGYASGDEAASLAWNNVAIQLTQTLDNVLRVVRDGEE